GVSPFALCRAQHAAGRDFHLGERAQHPARLRSAAAPSAGRSRQTLKSRAGARHRAHLGCHRVKTVAIIQARMGSTRLPGKVLMDLGGRPALAWAVRAARATAGVDEVWVATSTAASDDPVARWCDDNDLPLHRGSEHDVLDRYA